MSKFHIDDDSPEADAWRRYKDLWPGTGSEDEFIKSTQAEIRDGNESPEFLSPGKIRNELDKLKNAIETLSTETRTIVRNCELAHWHGTRASGEPFDDAYYRHWDLLLNGGSSLDRVMTLLEKRFDRRMQGDMLTRSVFYIGAARIFSLYGGKIESRRNAPFVKYVELMIEDAGIPVGDVSQSIRAFLERTPVVI